MQNHYLLSQPHLPFCIGYVLPFEVLLREQGKGRREGDGKDHFSVRLPRNTCTWKVALIYSRSNMIFKFIFLQITDKKIPSPFYLPLQNTAQRKWGFHLFSHTQEDWWFYINNFSICSLPILFIEFFMVWFLVIPSILFFFVFWVSKLKLSILS